MKKNSKVNQMSLTTKTVKVSENQQFSASVDIRFFGDKLYVCRIEPDGSIFQGAELIVDNIPQEAIYGSTGSSIARTLNSALGLDIPLDQFRDEDVEAFIAAITASNASFADALVIILGLTAGSTIIEYEVIFSSSVSDEDIQAAAVTLSDETAVTAALATDARFDNKLIAGTIRAATVETKNVKPTIMRLTVTPGDPGIPTGHGFHQTEQIIGLTSKPLGTQGYPGFNNNNEITTFLEGRNYTGYSSNGVMIALDTHGCHWDGKIGVKTLEDATANTIKLNIWNYWGAASGGGFGQTYDGSAEQWGMGIPWTSVIDAGFTPIQPYTIITKLVFDKCSIEKLMFNFACIHHENQGYTMGQDHISKLSLDFLFEGFQPPANRHVDQFEVLPAADQYSSDEPVEGTARNKQYAQQPYTTLKKRAFQRSGEWYVAVTNIPNPTYAQTWTGPDGDGGDQSRQLISFYDANKVLLARILRKHNFNGQDNQSMKYRSGAIYAGYHANMAFGITCRTHDVENNGYIDQCGIYIDPEVQAKFDTYPASVANLNHPYHTIWADRDQYNLHETPNGPTKTKFNDFGSLKFWPGEFLNATLNPKMTGAFEKMTATVGGVTYTSTDVDSPIQYEEPLQPYTIDFKLFDNKNNTTATASADIDPTVPNYRS